MRPHPTGHISPPGCFGLGALALAALGAFVGPSRLRLTCAPLPEPSPAIGFETLYGLEVNSAG